MASSSRLPNRRSIRLPDYDYSQPGAYFVTLVVHQRQPLFGQVRDGEMVMNETGTLTVNVWLSQAIYYLCELDEWVVMPDHFHAILWILEDPGAGEAAGRDLIFESRQVLPAASPLPGPKPGKKSASLGAIIQRFKSITTHRINALHGTSGRLWQRDYFERVIRNQSELDRAREYIRNNPLQWQNDHADDEDWWQ